MPSHLNLTVSSDIRTQVEKTLNAETTIRPGIDFGGPDTAANLRAMKGGANHDALCDRLAAAARERGRPLTATEISLVGEGKPLPPVAMKDREKTLADLEATVRTLTERLEALEQAQKKSTPVHLAKVERR